MACSAEAEGDDGDDLVGIVDQHRSAGVAEAGATASAGMTTASCSSWGRVGVADLQAKPGVYGLSGGRRSAFLRSGRGT